MILKSLIASGIFITCLFFITTLSGSFFEKSNVDPRVSLGKDISKVIEYVEKKYGFWPIGTSIAFPDELKSVGIHFQIDRQIPKNELYPILIDITNYLKNILNTDQALIPSMHSYPFEISDVEIVIFFTNNESIERVCHPDVNVAELSEGYFVFRTVDPENTNNYKSQIKEKFDPEKIK